MGKNTITVNSGKVKFTKYNFLTGALSTDPADIRLCTETVSEITRKETTETYDLPDGNSNYPMGIYEKGKKYEVGITFSSMSYETMAFLKNATIKVLSGNMEEIIDTSIPALSPYEIVALGNITGTPIIMNSNNEKLTKVDSNPGINQYSITAGTTGTKQSMSKTVTNEATAAGTATVTITAAGSVALSAGKALTVNLTASSESVNASEIRSVLQSDPDVSYYFDVSGTGADVVLTKKVAAASESEAFVFALGTATGATMGSTVSVSGVADIPAKVVFNASNAGMPITMDYYFEATGMEKYDVSQNPIIPVVMCEIVHETLSSDKTTKYKNNSKISKMQLTGDINEDLMREHKPQALTFSAVKPAGQNVVENTRVQIAL